MIHNINMVAEVADFLQNFCHDLSEETVNLAHLMLQALIEMCVGNYKNLEIIFNKQIIVIINRILLINISDCDGETPSFYTNQEDLHDHQLRLHLYTPHKLLINLF